MIDVILLTFGVGISFLTGAGFLLANINRGWERDESNVSSGLTQQAVGDTTIIQLRA